MRETKLRCHPVLELRALPCEVRNGRRTEGPAELQQTWWVCSVRALLVDQARQGMELPRGMTDGHPKWTCQKGLGQDGAVGWQLQSEHCWSEHSEECGVEAGLVSTGRHKSDANCHHQVRCVWGSPGLRRRRCGGKGRHCQGGQCPAQETNPGC